MAQLVNNPPAKQETSIQFLGQEDPLEKATHSSILRLPYSLAGKESTCHAGDLGSIPGLGRSPGKWNSYPLQYSFPVQAIIDYWADFPVLRSRFLP